MAYETEQTAVLAAIDAEVSALSSETTTHLGTITTQLTGYGDDPSLTARDARCDAAGGARAALETTATERLDRLHRLIDQLASIERRRSIDTEQAG